MALRTSVGTGDWSAVGTWDTGVPVDTDTFAIAAGHTVTFDVDQSAMGTGMGASSIAATGQLTVKDDGGSYYLKMNGDLTLNGTMQAGTSAAVPFTGVFTCEFNSGSNSIVINNTTGSLLLYCAEPTYKYVTLTAQEPAVETVLAVDTDISADWTNGDTVCIVDLVDPTAGVKDGEEDTIAGMSASTITLTGGLANQKEIGSVVVLITRNIRLINSTDYPVKNGSSGTNEIYCEIYNCASGGYSGVNYATIGGSILVPNAASARGVYNSSYNTIDIAIAQVGSTGSSGGIYSCLASEVLDGSIMAGMSWGFVNDVSMTSYSRVVGCVSGCQNINGGLINNEITGCQYPIRAGFDVTIYSDISNADRILYGGGGYTLANCEIGKSVGGVASTYVMFEVNSGIKFYNCLFSATTDFWGYTDARRRLPSSYIESFNHNQVVGVYKAWVLGGIVTSQTASPPTGYSLWYELACESAAYPCFRQYETVVLPGTAIEVVGQIRIADAVDHTAYPPALQIIGKFADPFVDSTQSPLAEDEVPVPDGSDATWQEVSVIWANTGDAPRQVIVRMIAQNAAADVDTVWAVATYQDQIATLYNILIPVRTDIATSDTATSFTLTAGEPTLNAYRYAAIIVQDADDAHYEVRKINAWTAGRVVTVANGFSFTPAVGDKAYIISPAYGPPVDLTVITDKLPDNYIMGSSVQTDKDDEIDETIARLKRIGRYP